MSTLVEVRFTPDDRTAWVRAGATLLEAGEAAGVDIVTGCTRGMCGTDAVRVVSGVDHCEPPAVAERGTLERMGLGPDWRLACSARLRAGPVQVELGAF